MAKIIKRWGGPHPVKCDFCNHRFNNNEDKHFYDFQNSLDNHWGLGCEPCFKKYGTGIGTGLGQKYNLLTMEKEDG